MNLGTLFEFAVHRYPNHIALVEGERRYTYEQLDSKVNRVASSLQKLGLKKKDRVMALLKNRVETIILFWAVQKLGAVYTPINLRFSSEDIQYCVNDIEAKMLFYELSSQHAMVKEKFNGRPMLISMEGGGADISFSELSNREIGYFKRPTIEEDDLAVILYTSGTSGRPKGVPRSHKNEYTATMAHIVQYHYQMFDSTLGAASLSHTMGLRSLLAIMMLNGKYVAMPDFDPEEVLRIIQQEHLHTLYLTPVMYHDILHEINYRSYDFSSLRTIGYAGAPMSPELVSKCDEVFKPTFFYNHYGSTEIYTFTFCPDIRQKPGCAGIPGIHQNIRLVVPNSDGKSTPRDLVEPGEVGEIIVSNESVEAFKGYWNRPDATRSAIRDGWYFTGDLGVLDEDNQLFVVGRVDEMIITGGENIYPQEIENILQEHSKVREAMVVGEEDEKWGQNVVSYIVPVEGARLTAQELDCFCKRHPGLSNFKRPRKYIFVTEIPKGPTGKITRRQVKNSDFTPLSY